MSETKYLYYHLYFYKDGDYQHEWIAEDLKEVAECLQSWEIEFDDEEGKAEIRIKGVGLTKKSFEYIRKDQQERLEIEQG